MSDKEILISLLSEKNDINKSEAERLMKSFVDIVLETIEDKHQFSISGLGTFKVKHRDARDGRNPKTQEKIRIPASKTISFKPLPSVKEKFNKK